MDLVQLVEIIVVHNAIIPAEFPVIVIKLLVAVALRLEYAGVDGTGVAAVVIE